MIIWLCSLVWASLIFGVRVHGSPNGIAKRQAEQPGTANFNATVIQPMISLNTSSTVYFSISTQQTKLTLSIFLCQASEASDEINSTNAYQVAQLFSNICINGDIGFTGTRCAAQEDNLSTLLDADTNVTSSFDLTPMANLSSLSNFFLCFAQITNHPANHPACEAYSPVFDLIDPEQSQTKIATAATIPPSRMFITLTSSSVLLVSNTTISNDMGSITTPYPTPASTSAISTSYVSTTSPGSTTTTTISLSSTAETSSLTSSHPKGGLSTGALIGIIVGAVGGALVLALLGLLYLRRRKHTRNARSDTLDSNQPEHVLLTQPHTSIGSRDPVAEKDSPTTLASMLEAPLSRPVLPQNSHHSYDSINASAPYSGIAAGPPKPRAHSLQQSQTQNQPHQQSLLSHSIPSSSLELSDAPGPLTRGVSDASAPMSPRTVSSVRGERDDFEEYHDMPIYGDARHIPTVYENYPSVQAYGEEGMSAEDMARLEEEERRIDAAIAAAEEESGRR